MLPDVKSFFILTLSLEQINPEQFQLLVWPLLSLQAAACWHNKTEPTHSTFIWSLLDRVRCLMRQDASLPRWQLYCYTARMSSNTSTCSVNKLGFYFLMTFFYRHKLLHHSYKSMIRDVLIPTLHFTSIWRSFPLIRWDFTAHQSGPTPLDDPPSWCWYQINVIWYYMFWWWRLCLSWLGHNVMALIWRICDKQFRNWKFCLYAWYTVFGLSENTIISAIVGGIRIIIIIYIICTDIFALFPVIAALYMY